MILLIDPRPFFADPSTLISPKRDPCVPLACTFHLVVKLLSRVCRRLAYPYVDSRVLVGTLCTFSDARFTSCNLYSSVTILPSSSVHMYNPLHSE